MTEESSCFDRDGNPISTARWKELQAQSDYKVLIQTQLDDRTVLSTVWVGVDRNEVDPAVFESMLFAEGHPMDRLSQRYRTEAEARLGHAELATIWMMENSLD